MSKSATPFKLVLITALSLIFIDNSTHAQTQIDSLQYGVPIHPGNQLSVNFDKQLNTYFLNTALDVYGKLERFEFKLYENFISTLVKTGTSSIRDQQYFNLRGKYQVVKPVKLGLNVNSSILSDDRQLAINQATINHAALFTEFELIKNIYLIPYAGYSDNRQVGENDRGPLYGFEGSAENLNFTDLSLSSTLKLENEDISPRKNILRFFDLDLKNTFSPGVINLANASFSQSRKDFYFPSDSITSTQFDVNNNIESRTETIFQIRDMLTYNKFLELFTLEISGSINWRNIDRDTRYRSIDVQSESIFDTKIEELGIRFESSLLYRTKSFSSGLRINFLERDEKHLTKRFAGIDESFYELRSEKESRKNNNSGRIIISLFSNYNPSKKNRITLSLFHSKLRYDTPSGNNDDDRDELLTIARLRYSRFLSPFFETYIDAEGTLSKVVYLFAGRSANNNVNRILRLLMGGYYKGARFSSLNNFEVSANYTVYDFEDLATGLRSISFRQFTATDSTRWQFTKSFSFIVNAYIKLTDQGDLDWNDFAERSTRFVEEVFADPKIGYNYGNAFVALGLRYFSLRTFNYEGRTRILDTKFLSIGPLVEVVFGSKSLYLKLYGWYEFISRNDIADKERTNLIAEMNWKF